jgi:hypothetical protein
LYISSSGAITTKGIISGSNALSASYAASASNAISGAYAVNATTASYAANATTSSYAVSSSYWSGSITNALSASYADASANAANATLFNSTASSVFSTTGSNTLTGTQYVSNTNNATAFSNTTASIYTDGGLQVTKDAYFSSSMFIKGNLTVFGTQSVSFISSSQLNIGTNLITVNTDTPSIRFGGLAVYDSGSTGLTGSILWDSQNNHWVYTNPSGSSYSGGMFISGPRASSLGSEQGTTLNAIMKGQGGDHITSSIMFESASFVGIGTSNPVTKLEIVGNVAMTSTNPGIFMNGSAVDQTSLISNANGPDTILKFKAGSFIWANSDDAERMRIASSGNVGIGTTSPSTISTYRVLEVTGPNTSTGGMIRTNISDNSIIGKFYTNSTGVWVSAETSHPLILETANIERMRIASGGNVGIGTTSPSSLLHIYGAGTGAMLRIHNTSTVSSNQGPMIQFQSANQVGGQNFESGYIQSIWQAEGNAFGMRFAVKNVDSSQAEVLRINYNGNIGIGTTNPSNILTVVGGASSPVALNLSNANSNCDITMTSGAGGGLVRLRNNLNDFQIHTNGNQRMTITSGGGMSMLGPYISMDGSGAASFTSPPSGLGYGLFPNSGVGLGLSSVVAMSFWTGGTPAERMRIDSSGNVGIGITNPSNRLTVSGNASVFGHLLADRHYTTRGLVASTSGNWVNLYQLPTNYNYVILIHVRQPETFYTYTTIAYIYNYYNGANNYPFVENYVKSGSTSLQISGGFIQARQNSGSNASMYWDITIFGTLDTNF